jgi:hypothetical protein
MIEKAYDLLLSYGVPGVIILLCILAIIRLYKDSSKAKDSLAEQEKVHAEQCKKCGEEHAEKYRIALHEFGRGIDKLEGALEKLYNYLLLKR